MNRKNKAASFKPKLTILVPEKTLRSFKATARRKNRTQMDLINEALRDVVRKYK